MRSTACSSVSRVVRQPSDAPATIGAAIDGSMKVSVCTTSIRVKDQAGVLPPLPFQLAEAGVGTFGCSALEPPKAVNLWKPRLFLVASAALK
ncbi:MAG: hypothetical protein WDN49_02155 [Acetobacteraceae bacterium]